MSGTAGSQNNLNFLALARIVRMWLQRPPPAALAPALLLLLAPLAAFAFDVLASTALQRCADSGGGPANCSLMLVVTGTLQNGESDGSGELLYSLANAAPAQLPGGDGFTAVAAPDALSLTLFQSAITLRYPTRYVEDVNDGAYEATYLTDGSGAPFGALNPCRAGASDATPGCGWMVDSDGHHIPFSQGFCCDCSFAQQLTGAVITRSGQTCSFTAQRDSAQCLRMAPLWHSLYSIGAPQVDFVIVLTIMQCRPTAGAVTAAAAAAASANSSAAAAAAALACPAPGPGCECATLDTSALPQGPVLLGPTVPTACFALPFNLDRSACDVKVALQGTFVAYEGTPDFSSQRLLIPTACAAGTPLSDACWRRLVESPEQWLVVDASGVSTAGGGELNTVGVGYEAFATQGTACSSPRGTGLSNQPAALYAADAAAVAAGRAPTHFLSAFREPSAPAGAAGNPGLGASVAQLLGQRTAASTLSLPTRRFQKSVITLTLRADPGSLRLVVRAASGRILSATAAPFPAGSVGALAVLVTSTGAVASHFTLSVACPPAAALLPVPALELSVGAFANASVVFALHPAASTAAAGAACSVTLTGALGAVLDTVQATVSLSSAVIDDGGQGGSHGGGNGGGAGGGGAGANTTSGAGVQLCGSHCAAWYDVACAASAASACVAQLSGWAAGFGGLGLLLGLIALKKPALLLAPLRALLGLCCAARGGGASAADAEATAPASAAPRRVHKHKRAAAPAASASSASAGSPAAATAVSAKGRLAATLAASSGSLDGPALVELLRRSVAAESATRGCGGSGGGGGSGGAGGQRQSASSSRVAIDVDAGDDDDPREAPTAASPPTTMTTMQRHHHKKKHHKKKHHKKRREGTN